MYNPEELRWNNDPVWQERALRTGFFATHASGLFFAFIGEMMSVLVLLFLGPLIMKWGLAAVFYLGLTFFAIAAFAYLPIHWALRHRRLHRIASR